jgi:hypothetical protein
VRAKRVKNQAKINAELSPNATKTLSKRLKKEIKLLKLFVDSLRVNCISWRTGISVAEDKYFVPVENFELMSVKILPPFSESQLQN